MIRVLLIYYTGRQEGQGPYGRPSQRGISTRRGRGTSKQSRQQSTDGVK